MSSFNSSDNNSIIDVSTPLPAILNHETSGRLNTPTQHNYTCVEEVFLVHFFCLNSWKIKWILIQLLFMHQFVERVMKAIQTFNYIILLMLECITKMQNILQLLYLGGIMNILICFIMIFMIEYPIQCYKYINLIILHSGLKYCTHINDAIFIRVFSNIKHE